MTNCPTTRDWILGVDPEELELGAPGKHADHLAGCTECRALADGILRAEAALREGLDSVEPALDVAAALDRARQAHEAATHQVARRRRRRQVALPLAVPLAAAALGGLLLMNRPSPAPVPEFNPATVRAARTLGLVGARPVVRAESHERVAVLPTENPNITVIWFME